MPKAPPTIDRFRLSCECEVSDLGGIIAQLTKMGMTNLNFELVTDVQAFRKKTNHDIKAEDFLTAWIKDHPTFRAKEVIQAFRADGRTAGAGYTALRVLAENKVLKKLGEGQYSRTDVKAIAAPKAKSKPAKPVRKTFDKPGSEFILGYMRRNHGRCNTQKLTELFEADGRARNSVYASIDKLVKGNKMKRVGDAGNGQYELIKEAKQSNSNGAAVETANG